MRPVVFGINVRDFIISLSKISYTQLCVGEGLD